MNCQGMLHWVILSSGMRTCSHQIYQPQVCRKINLQKGKINKNRGGKNHIPHLKGRSSWDMFLTQRYMLAHIPLTKINILASVLTFTSSFSSHLNHYNTTFPCSLPCAYPSKCLHQLALLQPLSAAFYRSTLLSGLYQWQQPWSLSSSPPQHIRFHPSL